MLKLCFQNQDCASKVKISLGASQLCGDQEQKSSYRATVILVYHDMTFM